nr:M14 family zinc carboxypeptidase [Halomonas sp.]
MRPDYSDLFYTPVNTLWPTHVDVNDAYHALVAELPDYVSSNLLGVDAWDNEIWEFYFKPPGQSPHNTAYSDETIRLQKYLILGGVHAGTEKHAMVANYIFFEQLCREWKQWDRLDTFRWDVEFKTIPCLNPSGYDAGTRPNGNNIDLNRNAPTGWEVAGSGRGPSPASELETQIALAWAAANLDADLIVDHHRNRNLQNDQFGWIATDSDKGLAFAIKTVNQIVAFGKKHFDFIPQDNSNVRFVGQHINGSIMLDTHTNTPVESFLLETVRDVAGASNAIYTRRYLSVEALKIFLWNFYRKKQREREEFMPVVPTAGGGDDSEEDV